MRRISCSASPASSGNNKIVKISRHADSFQGDIGDRESFAKLNVLMEMGPPIRRNFFHQRLCNY